MGLNSVQIISLFGEMRLTVFYLYKHILKRKLPAAPCQPKDQKHCAAFHFLSKVCAILKSCIN